MKKFQFFILHSNLFLLLNEVEVTNNILLIKQFNKCYVSVNIQQT